LIIIFTHKTIGWEKIMHPKIPETEYPVQGFFYAGGADQNRGVLRDRDAIKEGGDRWSSDTNKSELGC
jgi:hypothetical protein